MNPLPPCLLKRPSFRTALTLMADNARRARELRRPRREHASGLEALLRVGLTGDHLHMLVEAGYVEEVPAGPVAPEGDWPAGPSYLLTPAGEALTLSLDEADAGGEAYEVRPRWDEAGRALWAEVLVKRLAPQSVHEAPLLRELERRGWSEEWLDDPLRGWCRDPKARLHEGVRALTHGLRYPVLTFEVERGGRQFRWRPL